MDSSVESADLNLPTLVGDSAKHLELWREHDTRLSEPAQLEGADFRGLVFRNHRFRNQSFVNCDFSRSRWLLAGIQDGDCSGSNFSGITTMFFDLQNMDCTGCNFSNATLWFGFSIDQTRFCGADFSGATLRLSEQLHKSKVAPDFTGAIMNGCTFINDSAHELNALNEWFTESQRTAMSGSRPPKSRESAEAQPKESQRYPFWRLRDVFTIFLLGFVALLLSMLTVNAVASMVAARIASTAVFRTILAQCLAYTLLFLVAHILFKRRYHEPFLKSMCLKPIGLGFGWAALAGPCAAVMVTFLGAILGSHGNNMPSQLVSGSPPFWALALMGTTLAPCAEETVFRGLLQPLTIRSFGTALGITVPAVLYAVMLLPQYDWTWSCGLLIVASGVWGWVRYITGSTTAAIVAHATYNALFFMGVFLSSGRDILSSKHLLEEHQWRACEIADAVDPCEVYLQEFPVGSHARTVLDKKHNLMWKRAEREDSVHGYRSFLDEIPREDPNYSVAEARLKKLEIEDNVAWSYALKSGTAGAIEKYLQRNGTPLHAEEAARRLDDKAWQIARASDTDDAYQKYLSVHPDGAHAAEARQELDPASTKTCVVRRLKAQGYNDRVDCIVNYQNPICQNISRYNAEVDANNECNARR
jgi:membrane protease YdiL (CAAX protease family)/uncharacterized protein YjbI with pentapeptide repeats